MYDILSEEIHTLQERNLLRTLTTVESEQSTRTIVNGKECIIFCSNNYLGLANHPKVKEAAIRAINTYGVGAGASRLLSGNMKPHEELEEKIANFKGTEAALIFSSGYLANIGILSALMREGDLVLADRLSHASVIDGCRLSGTRLRVYRHKNCEQLSRLLEKEPETQRSLVITEGVFSMDGDLAPLPGIVECARKTGAWIMVDEAHATGVMGEKGRGTAEHFGVEQKIDVSMGTFGKAFGTFGAYVAGSKDLISFLMNKAKPFIYTTALPPSVAAATSAALHIIEEEPERRKILWENRSYLHEGLTSLGYNTLESESPILPILIGETKRALLVGQRLFEHGVLAPAIRPPTVPQGTSRLRLSVTATHTRRDLDCAIEALERVGKELRII